MRCGPGRAPSPAAECEIEVCQVVTGPRCRLQLIEGVLAESVVAGGGFRSAQVMVAHEGSRPKAPTSSSAHGQPAAIRTVVRRAEETMSPALCKRV